MTEVSDKNGSEFVPTRYDAIPEEEVIDDKARIVDKNGDTGKVVVSMNYHGNDNPTVPTYMPTLEEQFTHPLEKYQDARALGKKVLPPFISASLIQMATECPRRWAFGHFHGKTGDGENFAFGTKFHNVAEKLKDHEVGEAVRLVREEFAGYDDAEIIAMEDAVVDIITADRFNNLLTIGHEISFEFQIRRDLVLTGHVDHLLEKITPWLHGRDKKTLIVRDYKTNRQVESSVAWTHKIQPRIYNHAIRQMYPGYDEYVFQVWYPRYSKTIEWKTSDESQALLEYVGNIHDTLQSYYDASSADPAEKFPPQLNAYCSYCAVRDTCHAYAAMLEARPTGLAEMLEATPLSTAWKTLDMTIKGLTDMRDQVKQKIVDQSTEGKYVDDGGMMVLSSRANVSYDADAVIGFLQDTGRIRDLDLDGVFTMTTTGAKKLVSRYEAANDVIETTKVTKRTQPSLELVAPKNKQLPSTSS